MLPRHSVTFFIFSLLLLCISPVNMAQEREPAPLEDMDNLLLNVDDIDAGEPAPEEEAAEISQQEMMIAEPAVIPVLQESEPNENITGNGIARDVILVLDNSGSMRRNDPDFLTSRAVTEFISGLDEATRLAIIIFDQDVRLAVPLTQVTLSNRGELLDSLDQINYRGLFTDSPAAMERAIYELKNNGREQAQKLIVFMTDGIVDTGNAQEDLDKSRWLRESLAPDAADTNIKIFGIAFTEDADFRLIQSLAQVTGGEYYRALRAEDLGRVFEQINAIIRKPPEPVSVAGPQPKPEAVAPQPPPVIIVPSPSGPAMDEQERIRSLIMIIAAAVMILAVLAILILLLRRGRGLRPASEEFVSEAYLNDIHGYTAAASYKLGSKPTMLGRVAGMDTEHLDYIVIPESTIGRRHSLIEYKDYAYWIVDQGSINGTFVNDVPITSEVRLKHGDRIRLHKYEFEFLMPEMVDAGMTVVSHTVMAGRSPDVAEATEIKGGGKGGDLDFDLLGTTGAEEENFLSDEGESRDIASEDETLMPGIESMVDAGSGQSADQEEPDYDSEDATLMPEAESEIQTPPHGTPVPRSPEPVPRSPEPAQEPLAVDGGDDETIMPGDFNLPEEDATIRKDADPDDKAFDNFFDVGGSDKDK